MAVISRLQISYLRNIQFLAMEPGAGINILHGDNGSGKTSMLEAIHLLGTGRSFRGTQLKPLVQLQQNECTLYGELDNRVILGVSKYITGSQLIKVSGHKAENSSELASILPLQLINNDTFRILEGSPSVRRQMIDWGVFHVEHNFLQPWSLANRALKHRNALLKNRAPESEIAAWTNELVRNAAIIDQYRRLYVEQLVPVFRQIFLRLLPAEDLSLEYDRGWKSGEELLEALNRTLERDRRYGFTGQGPHRADLRIKKGDSFAVDLLSRGQQKLLVCAMKIAQGLLLQRANSKQCVFLVDDLPSELDARNRALVCGLLSELKCQVFITGVEVAALDTGWSTTEEIRRFHVKHGKISD